MKRALVGMNYLSAGQRHVEAFWAQQQAIARRVFKPVGLCRESPYSLGIGPIRQRSCAFTAAASTFAALQKVLARYHSGDNNNLSTKKREFQ